MKTKSKDTIILGLALLAMFFGAGNLIFPPMLGLVTGKSWVMCAVGFCITGIGMPLLGIIASARSGGTVEDVGNRVGPMFSVVFSTVIVLAIGPLLAIPRTGATTFEVGIQPLFPGISPILVSVIFFGITLYFSMKPSGIIDIIGRALTPMLLLIIGLILFRGILYPIGAPADARVAAPLYKGFTEGYQTMDALGSIIIGSVMIRSLVAKGYTKMEDKVGMTIKAGIIAAAGLGIVYGGLMYLGSTASSVFPPDIPRTDLLVSITARLLGDFGQIALALMVSLACLTTSIGLTGTVGNYFATLTKNKLSYQQIVIATCVISAVFANIGVEMIVRVAVPLLVTVYPVAIVLILMSLFDFFPKSAYPGAVFGALLLSLYDGILSLGVFKMEALGSIIKQIPLAGAGFAWVLPAVICGIISTFLLKNRN